MHIAFNGSFWNEPRTGSGQYLRHLWEALPQVADSRNKLTLLLPPGQPGEDVPVADYSQVVSGEQMSFIGGRSGNIDKLLWEGVEVGRLAKSVGAELLHVPYLSAPFLPFKVRPTVVTAHDMIPWVLPGYSGSAAVKLYLRVAAACVKSADLILADSDASRQDVIKVLGVAPRKVQTVYLGMEEHPRYGRDEIAEMKARLGLPKNYAFYLGGFDKRKNVPLLLSAWHAALHQLSEGATGAMLVIGGGVPEPGGVFPDVMAEARSLGLTGQDSPVKFLGRVSEEDKPLIMAGARLFVYPSAYEGFGLDPLEAMSVGCPVVSSSGGSLEEVVGAAGVLVPPDKGKALADAIVRVWNSPALRKDLAVKGRDRAATFTWQKTAEKTLHYYQRVTNTKK